MTPNIRMKKFEVGDHIVSTLTGMERDIVRKAGEHFVIEHEDYQGVLHHDYVTLDRLQAYWEVDNGEGEQGEG